MFVLLTTKKYELEYRSANLFVSNDLILTLGWPRHGPEMTLKIKLFLDGLVNLKILNKRNEVQCDFEEVTCCSFTRNPSETKSEIKSTNQLSAFSNCSEIALDKSKRFSYLFSNKRYVEKMTFFAIYVTIVKLFSLETLLKLQKWFIFIKMKENDEQKNNLWL